jgi:Protein of unknown function (DUF2735)
MGTTTYRGTAKIYEFPRGGRAAFRAVRDAGPALADLGPSIVYDAAFSGSWYHEDAIRETQDRREP